MTRALPRRGTAGRRRGRRSALAIALVAGLALTPQAAARTTDHEITVEPDRDGPAINDEMYGVFYEDINRAADGGLYAELVQNRSFEYAPVDNPDYTPLTAWQPASSGGSAEVVDDQGRLNERNRNYLRLTADGPSGYGITNTGYNTGFALREGAKYDFSAWVRTDQPAGTPLTAVLRDPSGAPLSQPLELAVRAGGWAKYTGTLTATRTSDRGRLEVSAAGPATLGLDMISLFPQETFENRPNGMRADLAEKIAALDPGFLRFPGGCLVNTGSHRAYEAPNWERERSYQWKDTIGPVEQRATNANFWGYNQSYGLGYFEYFQSARCRCRWCPRW